jgi:Bacterial aa3 type cytochrome c oxidase subunit IV
MSEAVHDYTQGDMDITEQLSTFSLVGKMIKWGSLAVAVLLVMLVLWFCVQAGFLAGAGAGLVLAVIGVFFLRAKPVAEH